MKKIVVIGPESTGKSTLCRELADHFQTLWCPEYAREYLLKYGTKYSFDDLLTIAKGQLALEEEYTHKVRKSGSPEVGKKGRLDVQQSFTNASGLSDFPTSKLLFIDTNLYVMKVWCEFVFGKCHKWILDQIVERTYDYYLLCNTDLPWVKDELREYPDLKTRETLFHMYKDLLMHQPVPWTEIRGDDEARSRQAIEVVSTLL